MAADPTPAASSNDSGDKGGLLSNALKEACETADAIIASTQLQMDKAGQALQDARARKDAAKRRFLEFEQSTRDSTKVEEMRALCTLEIAEAEVDASAAQASFDAAQAHVLMGQPGFKRDDPDYFPLIVCNYILGVGGFVSRLTEQVRQQRALSYSVYSYFAPSLHAGAFTVGLETRPDQAQQALDLAREVVAKFVAEGPTEAELRAAKDYMVGGFALRIDSNRKLLDNVANMAAHDLPLDYLDTWTAQVDKVSLADIRRAFARVLQPERMVTVIVGATPADAGANAGSQGHGR